MALDIEVRLGNPSSITSNSDNDTTKELINGGLVFQAGNVGPGFGTNLCGMEMRTTGETNMDPSFVTRADTSFTWEIYKSSDGGIPWGMNLTRSGLLVGGLVGDTYAYPQARLDVRGRASQNTARFVNMAESMYIRLQQSASNRDACFIFDDANGEPVSCFGRCGQLLGRSMSEINYGKYVNGTGWVYGGTLYSW